MISCMGTNAMDELSKELEDYLAAYSKAPHFVSEKMGHYTEHLLHLLNPKDEKLLADYYGLYQQPVKSIDQLAFENKTTPNIIVQVMGVLLRRLSVTPEWQMMKSLIPKK